MRRKRISLIIIALLVFTNAFSVNATTKGYDITFSDGITVKKTAQEGVYTAKTQKDELPVAVSKDGKKVVLAQNDTIEEVKPVTDYKSNTHKDFINYRKHLGNTYNKITNDKELTVVYFGGSVTAGYGGTKGGWRQLSMDWFREAFPETKFNFVNNAIGETGTFLGTYRLQNDVIPQKPDLLFIEYAINDYYMGIGYQKAALQYETIVREVKRALPDCDIVTLLVIDQSSALMLPELYGTASGHEEIAKIYNIPTVNVGASLINSMNNFRDTDEWEKYFIDIVHPTDLGYEKYFECLKEYLENSLLNTDYSSVEPTVDVLIPVYSEYLLDGNRQSFFGQEISKILVADKSVGVAFSPDKYNSTGDIDHNGYYYLEQREDAQITVKFSGTELAMWSTLRGTSQLEVTVDGETKIVSGTGQAPTVVVSDLNSGEHTVIIKSAESENGITEELEIGAFFIRDSSKQSKLGDVQSYLDYNLLSLTLPEGDWQVKTFKDTDTVSNLEIPKVKKGYKFVGWMNENGELLEDNVSLKGLSSLTASVVKKGYKIQMRKNWIIGIASVLAVAGATVSGYLFYKRNKKKEKDIDIEK